MQIINTYCPGMCRGSGVREDTCLLVVLTQDDIEKFAAYMGLVSLNHDLEASLYMDQRMRAANYVAGSGSKLNYNMARGFFPTLREEEYRE